MLAIVILLFTVDYFTSYYLAEIAKLVVEKNPILSRIFKLPLPLVIAYYLTICGMMVLCKKLLEELSKHTYIDASMLFLIMLAAAFAITIICNMLELAKKLTWLRI